MSVPTSADPYPYSAVGRRREGELGRGSVEYKGVNFNTLARTNTYTLGFSLIQFRSLPLSLTHIYIHTRAHIAWVMKCWCFETLNYPLAGEDTCC